MTNTDRRIAILEAIRSRLATTPGHNIVGWEASGMVPGQDAMWVAYGPQRDTDDHVITIAVIDDLGGMDDHFIIMAPAV